MGDRRGDRGVQPQRAVPPVDGLVPGDERPGAPVVSVDDLKRELEQRVRITARRTSSEWERQVKQDEPFDTGLMVSRTKMTDRATSSGFVVQGVVDTDYAEMVSGGTRPHVIRPRRARALRFTVGGQTVFATRVNHPGTRPNDFWTRPLERLSGTVQRIWASLG